MAARILRAANTYNQRLATARGAHAAGMQIATRVYLS